MKSIYRCVQICLHMKWYLTPEVSAWWHDSRTIVQGLSIGGYTNNTSITKVLLIIQKNSLSVSIYDGLLLRSS